MTNSNSKSNSFFVVLPSYLMVILTIVYVFATWKMFEELKLSNLPNEPIIDIQGAGHTIVNPTESDELWLVRTSFTNVGQSVARELRAYVWFDQYKDSPMDLSKAESVGPFSFGPGSSFTNVERVSKALVNDHIKQKRSFFKHSAAFYKNSRGEVLKSELTEEVRIAGNEVIYDLISVVTGEIFEEAKE